MYYNKLKFNCKYYFNHLKAEFLTIMEIYLQSDEQILNTLGQRIKQLRLARNLTQQALSDKLNLSLNTIKSLEKGRAKLATLIAVLRELEALDQLQALLQEEPISPLQLAKLRGKSRERASKQKPDELPW